MEGYRQPVDPVEGTPRMYGPLIAAACVLFSIAGVVLYLHDVAEARSRKAFERIFAEGRRR